MPALHVCEETWQDMLYAETILEDYTKIETPSDLIRALVDVLEEWNEFKEAESA
jgi:hypothetical protein